MVDRGTLQDEWSSVEQWDGSYVHPVGDWLAPLLHNADFESDLLIGHPGLNYWRHSVAPRVPVSEAVQLAVLHTQRGSRWDTASADSAGIASRFQDLLADWKRASLMMAGPREMALHPAYQQIIGLGAPAVPLILSEMRAAPDHWFWALASIAGRDVAAGVKDFDEATEKWLAWGRSMGLVG